LERRHTCRSLPFVLSLRLPHNFCIRKVATIRSPRAALSAVEGVSIQTDARLGSLIRLLNDYATVVVSGTKIADEIGTTRSEVWRLVQQLRSLGVSIEGHPATGYRLHAVPDLLLPEVLSPLVRSTIFSQNIRHYFKIGSTNVAAMQAASEGAAEGTVFLAEQQTAGKGRGGHTWHSTDSAGIYCSVILRPALPPAEVVILSLAAALAVQSAVQLYDPKIATDLKWPNDLLIGDKKFCGILTEMNAEATRVRYLVIGVGINVNHEHFPAALQPIATSLRLASGKEWSRVELCTALLKSLDREYRSVLEKPDARESVLKRFQERSSSVRDRKVYIDAEAGGYEGTTYGLDASGFLQVRTMQGLRTVLTGSMQLL
jgi:BirA family biotin operon repressor/biotin-[acetyl-CoA-carboxylase] ligase